MRRRDLLSLAVAAIGCVAPAHADTIYRCTDGQRGVLYSNLPCPGGRTLDLPDAKPDPAARERLQREIDAFERRQAVREAAQLRERESQAERNRAAARAAEQEQPATYAEPIYSYGLWYPYAVRPSPRPPRLPGPRMNRPPSYVPAR